MTNLLTNPEFLRLAVRAQESFAKSMRMDDSEATTGLFSVHDMLDMLEAEFDRKKDG